MALAERRQALDALSQERRRHQRVKVSLLGRDMLTDHREFPCQVVDMSLGGMAVIAPVVGITLGGLMAPSRACSKTDLR
jgi:hypothetical protein